MPEIKGVIYTSKGEKFEGVLRWLPEHPVVDYQVQSSPIQSGEVSLNLPPGYYLVQFCPEGKISPFRAEEEWLVPDVPKEESLQVALTTVRKTNRYKDREALNQLKQEVESRYDNLNARLSDVHSMVQSFVGDVDAKTKNLEKAVEKFQESSTVDHRVQQLEKAVEKFQKFKKSLEFYEIYPRVQKLEEIVENLQEYSIKYETNLEHLESVLGEKMNHSIELIIERMKGYHEEHAQELSQLRDLQNAIEHRLEKLERKRNS